MRESIYTASIGKLLPPSVYKLKLCLPYTAGVADSWYSGAAGDLWVEWKYLKSIPHVVDLVGGKHPMVSKLQQHWLRGRHAEGRRVAVIVGCREGAVILPGLQWTTGMSRDDFRRRLVSRRDVANWIANQTIVTESSG